MGHRIEGSDEENGLILKEQKSFLFSCWSIYISIPVKILGFLHFGVAIVSKLKELLYEQE